MPTQTLNQIDDHVARGNRAAALELVRAAICDGRIGARDGIELMLAVRQGTLADVKEALDTTRSGLPGAYRFAPFATHAFA